MIMLDKSIEWVNIKFLIKLKKTATAVQFVM